MSVRKNLVAVMKMAGKNLAPHFSRSFREVGPFVSILILENYAHSREA